MEEKRKELLLRKEKKKKLRKICNARHTGVEITRQTYGCSASVQFNRFS